MLVLSVEIDKFRNFTNQQVMAVDPAVTCLIGKNESGKTTILKALHRLNPANNPDDFNVTTDYPRRHLSRDRRSKDLDEVAPVKATFSLEETDLDELEGVLGVRPPAGTLVEAARTYGAELKVRIFCDLNSVLEQVIEETGIDDGDDRAILEDGRSIAEIAAAAKARAKEVKADNKSARAKVLDRVPTELNKYVLFLEKELDVEQHAALVSLLPRFFYFSTYEMLPGECNLNALADRKKNRTLRRGDSTMLSLLRLAGEGPEDFLDDDYDSRKAELQAASLDLSEQVFQYWKQNDALKVVFDTDLVPTPPDPQTDQPQPHHRILKIELRDERHGDVETNFSTRSTGFQWFFSFLAAFSAYRDKNERVVVLLDEPGTSLHGEAQGDFLRYIYGELGTKQQVFYTTHSQHMIDPTRYETMRAIHDQATRKDASLGVVITPVSLSADPKTILPVEAALGYSVAQHLFLGAGPLLAVEGSSDFIFLMRMSDYLISQGRIGLDPRLAIIPVGGIGNMPAFVAVMGRRLTVRALIDGAETTKVTAKVLSAAQAANVDASHITVIGQLEGLPETADIEDLFSTKDYLWLYNRSLDGTLNESDLITTQKPTPILMRIGIAREQQERSRDFDHVGPAHQLTRDRDVFFEQVDDETLDRFEKVFKRLAA
ncbi:AAA family ATPase [Streptosporangium sp. NPDC006007]|uniref:AAA family ATPase n=1 Tax=Streptosporangium sp. NPDC006007 TaxID=3154575 RepID=UPI0033A7E8CF